MADLASALQHLLKAKRISAPSQSYRKDNPAEYAKVEAYINGGPRPTGITTEMGLGLVEVEDVRRGPAPPDPPPPTGPVVISAGGTYKGHWVSDQPGTGGAAVRVTTAQLVVIEDSIIENTNASGWGAHSVQGAAKIHFKRCTFKGKPGNTGRALNTGGSLEIKVENCLLEYTGGIYLQGAATGANFLVSKNRCLNVTGNQTTALRQFFQVNASPNMASCVIEWNEILNTFGQSVIEDCISIHNSSGAIVRNNFIRGGYPAAAGDPHSGMGILLSDNGGNNNLAENNQVVAYTNGGIGITGGSNNRVRNNRVVSDGRLDDGTELWATNQGMICYQTTPGNNNTFTGNYIGWMQGQRYGHPLSRSDYYCPTADNNVNADNTFAYGNHTTHLVKADEDAEWPIWQSKLAAAGVSIGP